jgi:hypothetical protein
MMSEDTATINPESPSSENHPNTDKKETTIENQLIAAVPTKSPEWVIELVM